MHLELDTHQVASVFLKLERCSGTITWCRPPWKDPRFGFGLTDNNGSSYSLDTVETAVSPGLRLKYTNRSGESLAYQVPIFNLLILRSKVHILHRYLFANRKIVTAQVCLVCFKFLIQRRNVYK